MNLPSCFAPADLLDTAVPAIALDSAALDGFLGGEPEAVRQWVAANGFRAEPGTVLLVPGDGGTPLYALIGITDAADPFALAHAPTLLPEGLYRLDAQRGLRIAPGDALLGWGLGAYRFDRYRSHGRAPARLALPPRDAAHDEAAALLRASVLVRDLVNTPTEHMGPEQLEQEARRLAELYGGQMRAIVGDALLAENFPAIHAVGRASHRAPRLIELSWGEPTHPHVAIVGKGVCFDTGGLDIKPADGMRNMKKDMGGAAHALALAKLVMMRKLPVRLTLLIPAVENAIAGNAYRPGEVIITRKGLSVEIDNTDAEGRVVLCDALAYAVEKSPALLLDFATLTGAARIALGPDLPALYANDEALARDWLAAAEAARDPLWRMPLWRPYMSYLKSGIADLANAGSSRMAGSITAALYLDRFVPQDLPWAHIDVYAWNDTDRPGRPAGGEAQGLRAAFALLRSRYAPLTGA